MNNTPERWLPIPGYEDLYDISDHGRVRSWHPWRSEPVPRLRSLYSRDSGHLGVALCKDGIQISAKVHQLVLLAFVGPRPCGMETRHLDGDCENNVLSNLVYGTKSENMLDSVQHGTHYRANNHKIHCKHGHPMDEANTYLSNKRRHCRTCRRIAARIAFPSRREYFLAYNRANRAAKRAAKSA